MHLNIETEIDPVLLQRSSRMSDFCQAVSATSLFLSGVTGAEVLACGLRDIGPDKVATGSISGALAIGSALMWAYFSPEAQG